LYLSFLGFPFGSFLNYDFHFPVEKAVHSLFPSFPLRT
jgi:hypothetical protein